MKLFKSKAEKEQERKMQVKRAMREMEKRIRKLQEQEAKYIQLAKQGMEVGLPEQVKLAKEALRMTISERKRTYKMYLNAQIISQMKDMTAMTNEFLGAIHVISKDISDGASADMSKLSAELRAAMERVSDQTENLGEMLEDSQGDVTDFTVGSSLVSDDELDSLIYGAAGGATAAAGVTAGADASIDAELEALKRQLNQ